MTTGPRVLPVVEPSEKTFTAQVIQLAQLLGWRTAHFRPGMDRQGRWRTAVQGDGKGFPDLLALKGQRRLVAELKVGRNKPEPDQEAWLAAFSLAGIPAFVWYPQDWKEIEDVLRNVR